MVVTLCVILLSVFETYTTHKDASEKEQTASRKEAESKKQVDDLTKQVTQERDENKQNADGFRQSFAALYNKYSDLAARVQNADLLREIIRTRKELKATQDKLNQPKARLVAGFWVPDAALTFPQETTVSRRADGSIAVDVIMSNPQ